MFKNIFSKSFAEHFPKTTALLDKARNDVFPAYAVGVCSQSTHSLFHTGGCNTESLFDLASLTKIICTTTLVAIFEENNLISVNDKLKASFNSFPDERVTLAHLLSHSSGFPPWLDLHSLFHEPDSKGSFNARTTPRFARSRYETEILKSWVAADFENKVTYSDLGFMLLGWALEKKTKTPIDALFQLYVVTPGNFASLQFLPVSPNVVPTENCPWRGHILRGEVHDDNAYVLGGVAAHAGLFGNIVDVLNIGKMWCDAYHGKRTLIIPQTAIKYFSATSVRSLGWDGVTPTSSQTGHYFSPNSRGHFGYTGTSLWLDLDKKLVVTLLTNRVCPTRANEKIKAFRPLFHDTLFSELGFSV